MPEKSTTILAIETSCDDTAISILRSSKGRFEVLASEISSQTKIHAQWGGVVPNLAAREHKKNIFPLLNHAIDKAGLSAREIDIIAVTQGPGLIPALLVGTCVAKTLAYLWDKPLIGIHHVEGHIYANFVSDKISVMTNDQFSIYPPQLAETSACRREAGKLKIVNSDTIFPALALVVSGGHTQLVLMRDHLHYEIVGQTLDDAAGEAFDKVARILDIGYPGGPVVARCAQNFQFSILNVQKNSAHTKYQIPDTKYQLRFPRPMLNKNNFDFSFSGLKTAVLYETNKHPELMKDENYVAEVCHEFQQAVVDVLVRKTIEAAKKYEAKTIMLAGGVSANKELRKQLGKAIEGSLRNPSTQSHPSYLVPDISLTGDNAVMIAAAAAFRWQNMSDLEKEAAKNNWKTIVPDANLRLQ